MDNTRESGELSSWKEIADYLGITVRTAQKWEPERRLPVHRVPGGRGRVYALVAELDAWKGSGANHPPRNGVTPAPKFGNNRLSILVAVIVLLVVVGVVYEFTHRAGPPSSWRVEGNTLVVWDDRGREVWRKTFSESLVGHQYDQSRLQGKNKVWFGDLGADGRTRALFTIDHSSEGAQTSALVCLSPRGMEEWRFTPGKSVQSGREHFSNHFMITRFAVAPLLREYPKAILVVSYNYPDYPTQVAILSPSGQLLREYWHSGNIGGDFGLYEWLCIADLNHDGRNEIYLGGVNNAYNQATLVVLDPETMSGASVEQNAASRLQGFAPGKEMGRILFPRTCINRTRHKYNGVVELNLNDGTLLVTVMEELAPPSSCVYYEIDANLHLRTVRMSDAFRDRHLQLFNVHELDHQWSATEEAGLREIRVFRSTDLQPIARGGE